MIALQGTNLDPVVKIANNHSSTFAVSQMDPKHSRLCEPHVSHIVFESQGADRNVIHKRYVCESTVECIFSIGFLPTEW